MDKIKSYRVVSALTLKDLHEKADSMILQGYEPFGGLIVSNNPVTDQPNFYQAFAIYEIQPIDVAELVATAMEETQSGVIIGGGE